LLGQPFTLEFLVDGRNMQRFHHSSKRH
jgi:hypothetical protein